MHKLLYTCMISQKTIYKAFRARLSIPISISPNSSPRGHN